MTYDELLDRAITDGLAAARADYAADPFKLQGAVEGFEACRGKRPDELVALHAQAERDARAVRDAHYSAASDYWRWRCKTLEIEWICNVISAGLVNSGAEPLLPHLPTARGVLQYAKIVGVSGEGSAS